MGCGARLWLGGGGEGGAARRGTREAVYRWDVECDEQDKDMPRATATATAKMQNSD